jgi:rhamnulokinase
MAQARQYIAVDLGAESGRVMLGTVTDEKLTLEQIHRFPNGPLEQAGTLRWDFDRILSEIKQTLKKSGSNVPRIM